MLQCYAKTDKPAECMPSAEDYLECLHHTKEVCFFLVVAAGRPIELRHHFFQIRRAQTVQAQFMKIAQERAKDSRQAAEITADGVIVGLGLISKDKPQEKGSG